MDVAQIVVYSFAAFFALIMLLRGTVLIDIRLFALQRRCACRLAEVEAPPGILTLAIIRFLLNAERALLVESGVVHETRHHE